MKRLNAYESVLVDLDHACAAMPLHVLTPAVHAAVDFSRRKLRDGCAADAVGSLIAAGVGLARRGELGAAQSILRIAETILEIETGVYEAYVPRASASR